MTTHMAFIRVKNVLGDQIDRRIPGDFPYQNFEIEEKESARYIAGGYEVMSEFEYTQMVIALAPEMNAYQQILADEQKQNEVSEKLSARSSVVEAVILDIVKYLELNLSTKEMQTFALNSYTSPMFNQIRALQFELAIQYVNSHPILTKEQKEKIAEMISVNINLA